MLRIYLLYIVIKGNLHKGIYMQDLHMKITSGFRKDREICM